MNKGMISIIKFESLITLVITMRVEDLIINIGHSMLTGQLQ